MAEAQSARRRPLIAVPARFSASASALRYAAEVTSRNLVEAVWAAGGEPLVMHPVASETGDLGNGDADIEARLQWADGVLLPGGGDLAGVWSGQREHPTLYDVDLTQDAFDLAVARIALAAGIPLLAICRGTQVVNVVTGGTLVQDMDEVGGAIGHHRHRRHRVSVEAGSLTDQVVGASIEASCYHHQMIATLGEGLVVTARSEEGVIEAVERPAGRGWFLGVQWHPEDNWADDPQHLAVFRAHVVAAADGRAAGAQSTTLTGFARGPRRGSPGDAASRSGSSAPSG